MDNVKYLNGLRYKSFSIVYMHTFGIEGCADNLLKYDNKNTFIKQDDNAIDKQIFFSKKGKEPVKRYKLPSFNVEITSKLSIVDNVPKEEYKKKGAKPYKDIEITFEGNVAVELSVFFNRTATLSFRLMVTEDNYYYTKNGEDKENGKDKEIDKENYKKKGKNEAKEDENNEYYKAGVKIKNKSEDQYDSYITTDHLISLVALSMGAEHWNVKNSEEKTPSNINLDPPEVTVKPIQIIKSSLQSQRKNQLYESIFDDLDNKCTKLNEKSDTAKTKFDIVCQKYREAILEVTDPKKNKKEKEEEKNRPLNFVYVDIWEDVNNYNYTLQDFKEEGDIIDYIRNNCKAELVGLMTLYPKEWPYREASAFDEVCGGSIAIDVDDYVLLNPSMCVCFGTYARRGKGSPTDWEEISKQRKKYHVSWPEYMHILEMVLAKKYTINAAKIRLLESMANECAINVTRDMIEENAELEESVTNLMQDLDAVNYSKFMSHKIMFDRTTKRLEIKKDEAHLKELMGRAGELLYTRLEIKNMRQSEWINVFLAFISIASLFEIVFSDPQMPFLERIGLSNSIGQIVSIVLQSATSILVICGIIGLVCYLIANNYTKRKNRNVYKSNNKRYR